MVGPLSDDDRRAGNRRLQAAFVALVGISAGLISLQVEPTALQFLGSVVGGIALGIVLVIYLYWSS